MATMLFAFAALFSFKTPTNSAAPPSGEIFLIYQTSSYWQQEVSAMCARVSADKIAAFAGSADEKDIKRVDFAYEMLNNKLIQQRIASYLANSTTMGNPYDFQQAKADAESRLNNDFDLLAHIY